MKTLKNHARRMRREIFGHQLRTRGAKYRSFLRYVRLFKYAAFSPLRGTFLESYYTLMRYLDDIVDGDAPVPEGYADGGAYLEEKIRFSEKPENPKDAADYLMLYCFETGERFGANFQEETSDILHSLLFDAKRRGKLLFFPEKELMYHFHLLDVRGTIRATLKIFKEDPEKYPLLGPLGLASRFYYDLRDFEADIRAGYVNISIEDARAFGIDRESLQDVNSPGVRRWFRSQAIKGLEMLEAHHRRLPEGRFSLLARATFPLVYEAPARRFFDGTLKGLSLSELPEKEAKTLPLGENYKTRKTYS
ncbi:MAG: class 1 isoprenoid biosynthesis enzyme [Lewinellaceae bacterium]|nr:class 1 isoprenoid biosynthesis enzyme [Lewinellaceae bacterium]